MWLCCSCGLCFALGGGSGEYQRVALGGVRSSSLTLRQDRDVHVCDSDMSIFSASDSHVVASFGPDHR